MRIRTHIPAAAMLFAATVACTTGSRIEGDAAKDLSANGTANCYVVSAPGKYKFRADVKGCSTVALDGTPHSTDVLWESFGTDATPQKGDIIKSVKYENGYISFTSNKDGNALIAAKDKDGNILWSWHIWACKGFAPEATAQHYKNGAGTMMDRNLGATCATKGNIKALGLMYQWGRKDPFLSGKDISSSTVAASTLSSWPAPVSSDTVNGTVSYANAHPTTFINYNVSNFDWYYTGSESTDDSRWQTSDKKKGLYDPCPYGWRIPDGGNDGIWSTAFGIGAGWITDGNWNPANKGMDFGATDRTSGYGTIWYPAAGFRSFDDGILYEVGSTGNYWSCTPNGYRAFSLLIGSDGHIDPSDHYFRAGGGSVRCCKE